MNKLKLKKLTVALAIRIKYPRIKIKIIKRKKSLRKRRKMILPMKNLNLRHLWENQMAKRMNLKLTK